MLASAAGAPPKTAVLYDVPVSNNGARCRMILYYKSIPDTEVRILSPADLGGLNSEAYRSANPQGKMPLLILPSGESIPESDTISRYLCTQYAGKGPQLQPTDPLTAARCDKICRLHDSYLAAVQSAMYKAAGSGGVNTFPPFGPFASRRAALAEIGRQLGVLESYADADGPYLLGAAPSAADCAVWPSYLFWEHMLPKFDAQIDGKPVASALQSPRLARWAKHMAEADEVGKRVREEITGALAGWDEKDRWAPIGGAGTRDTADPTLFDKILKKVRDGCDVRMCSRSACNSCVTVTRARRSAASECAHAIARPRVVRPASPAGNPG